MFSYPKVLLTMGLLGGFLSAHAQVGKVKGKLTYPDGTPASFAVVKCRDTALETLANSKGEFELSNLRKGEHHLEVQTVGHRQFFPTLEITSDTIIICDQEVSFSPQYLDEVIITGNAEPQTIRQSIYQVRSISEEQIKLRGASTIGTLLNTELGIRFSNDLALGTSDIELMGLSGQNVKILLNGIPLLDRGESRESLNQIDINTIAKIEIVEGPMSVIYGTDALAGVINIITKKNTTTNEWGITAKVQEETANNEYSPLHKDGLHNASVQAYHNWNKWQIGGGISRNTFGGWQGTSIGRAKAWMPKDQLLANGHIGYNTSKMQLRYRFNGTDEDLNYLGNVIGSNYSDKRYTTWRLFHQLEGQYHFTKSTNLSFSSSYTDYSRKTLTTNTDIITNKTTLSLEEGSQDRNTFQSLFGRAILSHKTNPKINWVLGLEYNHNKAAGARIEGAPTITDYAAFIIPEIKLFDGQFKLKPGARFIYNTVYNAPPIIPSINTKWCITPKLDLRMAYAKGFRAPSLRELYFSFYDASHAMHGNTNLKAESSNSINSFLNYSIIQRTDLRITNSIGIFFNAIQNRIDLALDPQNTSEYSYFNIDRLKTKGANWNSHVTYKTFQTSVGVQWVGLSNPFNRNDTQNLKAFTWTPEFTLTSTYLIPSLKTTFFLAWKLAGKRPGYEQISNGEIRATEIASYNMADFSFIRPIGKLVQFNAGVRNIFDVTNIRNSSNTEGAHNTGGNRPISYGRSYFVGLQVNFKKNP